MTEDNEPSKQPEPNPTPAPAPEKPTWPAGSEKRESTEEIVNRRSSSLPTIPLDE